MPQVDIGAILSFLYASKYFLIFIGCFSEGSVVMMATGALAQQGLVGFWPAFAVLMLGDILSDISWYCMGRFGGRPFIHRWGHIFGATPAVVEKVEHRFHKYHTSILIISKLTMGFGFAIVTLMTAGLLRVSFWRFVSINLAGGLIWVFALYSIGYHFGTVLSAIPVEWRFAGLLGGAILMYLIFKFANRLLAKVEW